MMHRTYIALIVPLLFLAFTGCGSGKETLASNGQPQKGTKVRSHSEKDFPYIEAFHTGVRLKTLGDVEGAIAAFDKCLTLRQDDDAVYYALSQLYLGKGDKVAAADHIAKASALDKENIWYIEEMAYLYYEAQEFGKAVPEFKKLVDHEPKNLDWLYGYGDCLLRTGKTEEAIKVLDKAEDVLGVNPELAIEKYNLYMSLKKESLALEEIDRARKVFPTDPQLIATLVDHYFQKGDSEKAIGFLEELVTNDPANGRARLALGDIYWQRGKKDKSYEQFKAAFICDDVEIDTKMKVLISIQERSYNLDAKAIELMELMVSQHPNDAKSHSIRGDYMLSYGDEKESLKSYKKALEFDKSQYPIWNQVLIMEYQNGDWETLYEDSKECMEYFTTIPTVYLLNGVGGIQTGYYSEAIDALEAGKALVVNDKLLEAEFLGQLGEAYFGKKELAEGKKYYEKAISLDPKSNLIKNNYAYRLAMAKVDLQTALSLINQALTNSPNQSNYLDTRGWVSFQMEKYEDALRDFLRAGELDPDQEVIREHIGDAYFKTGNLEKALECWKQALEMGSPNKNLGRKIETKQYHEPLFD